MGSFLLTTLQILNVLWVNQYLHKRGGDGFIQGSFYGFESIYDVKASEKDQKKPDPGFEFLTFVDGNLYLPSKHGASKLSPEAIALHAYNTHGFEFTRYLKGEFSMVLFDLPRKHIIISTDPLGLKPLYVSHQKEQDPAWGVSSSLSALQRLNLTDIHDVRPNTFQVWNFTIPILDGPKLWYEKTIHEWDETPRKLNYEGWIHALHEAINIRYYQQNFHETKDPIAGISKTIGRPILSKILNIESSHDPFDFLLQNTEIIDLCYNMTEQLEPWDERFHGNISSLVEFVSEECIYFQGFEDSVLISDLGAQLYFGSSKLEGISQSLLQGIQHKAFVREMVLGSFAVDVRSPFLDKNVIQEWLWLHPTLKYVVNSSWPLDYEQCGSNQENEVFLEKSMYTEVKSNGDVFQMENQSQQERSMMDENKLKLYDRRLLYMDEEATLKGVDEMKHKHEATVYDEWLNKYSKMVDIKDPLEKDSVACSDKEADQIKQKYDATVVDGNQKESEWDMKYREMLARKHSTRKTSVSRSEEAFQKETGGTCSSCGSISPVQTTYPEQRGKTFQEGQKIVGHADQSASSQSIHEGRRTYEGTSESLHVSPLFEPVPPPSHQAASRPSPQGRGSGSVASTGGVDFGQLGPEWSLGLEVSPAASNEYELAKSSFAGGDLKVALHHFRLADRLEGAVSPCKLRLTFMQAFMGPHMAFADLSAQEKERVVSILWEIERDGGATAPFRHLVRYALANTLFVMGRPKETLDALRKVIAPFPLDRIGMMTPPSIEGSERTRGPVVMAVATNEAPGLENLRASAAAAGVDFVPLGLGLPTYESWLKLPLYLQFLETLPPGRVVVGVDAFDVVVMPNLRNVTEVYEEIGCEILIAAEAVSWPDASAALLYPMPPLDLQENKRRYLNSGSFMGTAGALAGMMRELIKYDSHDDQRAFVRYFLEHRDQVCLDYGARVFLTLYGIAHEIHLDPQSGQASVPSLRIQPMVLHGNGRGGMVAYNKVVELLDAIYSGSATELVVSPDPFNVGAAHYEAKDWALAATGFLAKLQEDPNYLDARLNLGLVFINMGRHPVALQVFQEVLDVWSPGNPAAFLNAGLCAYHMGNYIQAVEYWKEGLRLNPFYSKLEDALDLIPQD